MALRNQPYLPLYVDDYLTDEKLNMCSPESQGVYIKILCIMHKSEEYGKVLLKQKDKQKDKQILNFAYKLARLLPFTETVILPALTELLDESVLYIEEDSLCQKRMIKDEKTSIARSLAGFKGGKQTQFAKAKLKANNGIGNVIGNNTGSDEGEKIDIVKFAQYFPSKFIDDKKFIKAWLKWLAFNEQRETPIMPIQAQEQLKHLVDVEDAVKQIELSITNNWKGLKYKQSGGNNKPEPKQHYKTTAELKKELYDR